VTEEPYLISKLKKMPAAHHAHRQMTAAQRAAEEWGFAERTVKGEHAFLAEEKAMAKKAGASSKKATVLHATEEPKPKAVEAPKAQAVKAPVSKAVHTAAKPKALPAVSAKKATGSDGSLLDEVVDPWHIF
jgi:hypothetical protein